MRACVGVAGMLLIVALCAGPLAEATEPSERTVEVAEPVPVKVGEPEQRVETAPQPVQPVAQSRLLQAMELLQRSPSPQPSPPSFEQFFGLERGASRPLVVRATEKELDVAAVAEDMSVMSRILEKALQEKFGEDFASSRLVIGGGSTWALSGFRGVQGIYLEGRGLLFMMRVKFPLLAPPEVKAPEVEEEAADSVWEQSKREVLGVAEPRARLQAESLRLFDTFIPERPSYDAKKVADVEKVLLEALKHASNIRNLNPEDSIAVVLLGGNATGGMRVEAYSQTKGVLEVRGRIQNTYIAYPPSGTVLAGPTQPTVLTVHVKKSDVDAFAQGRLTPEEFGGRATITTY